MTDITEAPLCKPTSTNKSLSPELDQSYLDSLSTPVPNDLLPPPEPSDTPLLQSSGNEILLNASPIENDINTWLNSLAEAYIGTKLRDPDPVHDPILLKLFQSTYSEANAINDPNKLAYDALRGTPDKPRLGAPLYILSSQQKINEISTKPADNALKTRYPKLNLNQSRMVSAFFIRDFAQLYGLGGLTLTNLVIEDNAPFSKFANEFNGWVDKVNERLPLANISERVINFSGMAHRDAIQLIPGIFEKVDRLAGSIMRDVTIQNNLINAKGSKLQGIFASDGAFKNIKIIDNAITTAGEHTITINGLLSGEIRGNKDVAGNLLPFNKVRCLPLRIGGGAGVYVIGFKNSVPANHPYFYKYEPIVGLDPRSDLRTKKFPINPANPNAPTFFDQVDMLKYHDLVRAEVIARQTVDYKKLMLRLVQTGGAVQV